MEVLIDKRLKSDRLYEISINNFGRKMIIVEYINAKNIIVKFDNDIKVKATYQQFKNGEIRNPYDKTMHGIGYIGVGKHKCSNELKKTNIKYETWKGMFTRCYSIKYQTKKPTYKNCIVCDEWHNFQNFGEWYDKNYYEVDEEKMDLDKDILVKGNKIYSSETCVFVPHSINALFIKSNALRGKYPIGVSWDKKSGKLRAQCSIYPKGKVCIGWSDSIEGAFTLYKKYKEEYIKHVAEKYKTKIPQRLYEAMNNYIVEITD
jgi:hypothetical protein